ncbi:MAG: exodeoxyribonuclease VII large subunit [Proteobacteria bacterium]|nr:exodeoxyribonuclease VII large subunit [Pseudomonadota bacterium]
MKTSFQAKVYSVDTLTTEIKKLLEMSYSDVWVEGEVSSLASPPSGHLYFTLKDSSSILKCVLFKNKKYLSASLPVEGERILTRGRISVYTARGDVQMICSYIEAAGEGQLRRQFDALKAKLLAEGLFEQSHKQPVPERPQQIALVTSSHGAVLHDIISTLKRRYPLVHLKVYPAAVQGDKAKTEIIEALELAIRETPQVIILARGGGSLEDLQVFNDEDVARAVFTSPIPVVSAIGHETDFVITDFVADLRAPTPTAAATLITPDIEETLSALRQYHSILDSQIQNKLNAEQQSLDFAAQRLKHPRDRLSIQESELQKLSLRLNAAYQRKLEHVQRNLEGIRTRLHSRSPENQLNAQGFALDKLSGRLNLSIVNRLKKEQAMLGQHKATLQAFNPLQTLARGYSILQNEDGDIIRRSGQVQKGEDVQARLHEGILGLEVKTQSK